MRAVTPAILLVALLSPAGAQDAPPDLKGVWSGVARSVVVGSDYHHLGTERTRSRPASARSGSPTPCVARTIDLSGEPVESVL